MLRRENCKGKAGRKHKTGVKQKGGEQPANEGREEQTWLQRSKEAQSLSKAGRKHETEVKQEGSKQAANVGRNEQEGRKCCKEA